MTEGAIEASIEGAIETWRRRLRYALAAIYGFIGVVHLVATDAMLPLMPDWVPQPRLVILATGLCEIAGAVGLLTGRFRRAAALGLASDTANFANSYAKAVNEGGFRNWAGATFDAAKVGLSAASMAPGVGVVPGAIAGALDLGQMAYNGIGSWLGS